jgi:hypothetical protein
MRSISVFVPIAFLAALGVGFLGRSPYLGVLHRRTHAADRVAIEKFCQENTEVTLSQDSKELIDIWTEDGVRSEAVKSPVVGKQAIQAENEKDLAPFPPRCRATRPSSKIFKSQTARRASGAKLK